MSPDRSRGKEKAAELLWVFIYNSRTNSYYWVVSKQRGGPRPPFPLEDLRVSLRQQPHGWLSIVGLLQWPGKSSVTWIIFFTTRQSEGGNRNRTGMDGEKFLRLDFSDPFQGNEGKRWCDESHLQSEQTWRRRAGKPPDEVQLNLQRVKLLQLAALGIHLAVKVFKWVNRG